MAANSTRGGYFWRPWKLLWSFGNLCRRLRNFFFVLRKVKVLSTVIVPFDPMGASLYLKIIISSTEGSFDSWWNCFESSSFLRPMEEPCFDQWKFFFRTWTLVSTRVNFVSTMGASVDHIGKLYFFFGGEGRQLSISNKRVTVCYRNGTGVDGGSVPLPKASCCTRAFRR